MKKSIRRVITQESDFGLDQAERDNIIQTFYPKIEERISPGMQNQFSRT
jgi:hypothetical protein